MVTSGSRPHSGLKTPPLMGPNSYGNFYNSTVLRNLKLCGNDSSFDHGTGKLTLGTFRGLNDKVTAITAKPRDQSSRKRKKSVPQAKFSREGHFLRQKVSLGILTNFNAVLNKRGLVPLPKG